MRDYKSCDRSVTETFTCLYCGQTNKKIHSITFLDMRYKKGKREVNR